MATVNLTTAASGNTPRGRKPYIIQNTIDLAVATTSKGTALASADVYQCLNIPAESVILHAGMEVTEILTGTSSDTGYDLGITGGDVDNFVDGFDADGAAAGALMMWDQSADSLLVRGASADAAGSSGRIVLQTAQTAVADGDIIGRIDWNAPAETGTDAIVVGASILAEAE